MKPRLVQSWPLREKPRLDVETHSFADLKAEHLRLRRELFAAIGDIIPGIRPSLNNWLDAEDAWEHLRDIRESDPFSLWKAVLFGALIAAIVLGFSVLILGG